MKNIIKNLISVIVFVGIFSTGASISFAVSAPSIISGTATNITSTSATLNGVVNPNGDGTTAYFETPSGGPFQTQNIGDSSSNIDMFPYDLTGLTPHTNYTFRIQASNVNGGPATPGEWISFTTLTSSNEESEGDSGGSSGGSDSGDSSNSGGNNGGGSGSSGGISSSSSSLESGGSGGGLNSIVAPTIAPSLVTNITSTTATLSAYYNTNGATITGAIFYYGTNPLLMTNNINGIIPSSSLGTFSVNISGLTSNTVYYFKIILTSNAPSSPTNSINSSFKTLVAPVISRSISKENSSSNASTSAVTNPLNENDVTTLPNDFVISDLNNDPIVLFNPITSEIEKSNSLGASAFDAVKSFLSLNKIKLLIFIILVITILWVSKIIFLAKDKNY